MNSHNKQTKNIKMFQRKRKSGVYLHNYTRFKTVTKIIFILIISSVIAADSKCKLTSKEITNCDQPIVKDDDSDNDNGFKIHSPETDTKSIPHKLQKTNHHNHNRNSNKLQLNEMKNNIYKFINDMINIRTSEILANSLNTMNQLKLQEQRDFGTKVSESDLQNDMMNIAEIVDYLDAPDDSMTNGRQLDTSEGRLFFFKGIYIEEYKHFQIKGIIMQNSALTLRVCHSFL